MNQAKLATVQPPKGSHSEYDSAQKINETRTPEIVIALCGPMGTPLHEVAQAFRELLTSNDFGYSQVEIIRLSKTIKKLGSLKDDASIKQLIEKGNELREKHGNEILIKHAISDIYLDRQKANQGGQKKHPEQTKGDIEAVSPSPTVKICQIVDSIKNVDELQLLRQVYGDMLHVVGVYTPIELRIERLSKKPHAESVHTLIDRDSGEEIANGQRVRETFPQADFFLRADTGTDTELSARVRRYVELMMGSRIITPTMNERAMYEAYSAARNSACLSRQVGAAITDQDGELLAVGWNDVPRAFGGLYGTIDIRSTDNDDHRCWNKEGGKCFNDEQKDFLSKQVIDRLVSINAIQSDVRDKAYELIRHDSQLRDLIEFSRAVHAEMHALLNASQAFGSRVRKGKLFVTTYPCHSCARHIVAAGIKEVFFLEPYRKSLATKLHSDSITESETDTNKVRIVPFDGVAPTRFLRLFSAPNKGRKDGKGRMVTGSNKPVTAITMEAIETLEGLAIKGLESG